MSQQLIGEWINQYDLQAQTSHLWNTEKTRFGLTIAMQCQR